MFTTRAARQKKNFVNITNDEAELWVAEAFLRRDLDSADTALELSMWVLISSAKMIRLVTTMKNSKTKIMPFLLLSYQ